MAVIVTKEIKRKRITLGVLAALVLASLLILYFGIFTGRVPEATVLPMSETGPSEVLGNSQVSDIKIKILEDERFKILKSPPGVPLNTNTTGKSNPFSD